MVSDMVSARLKVGRKRERDAGLLRGRVGHNHASSFPSDPPLTPSFLLRDSFTDMLFRCCRRELAFQSLLNLFQLVRPRVCPSTLPPDDLSDRFRPSYEHGRPS